MTRFVWQTDRICKTEKKVRAKFNGLNVLQILIRSVVPKSSYEDRTKSNFNFKEIGEILGDPKITLLIFRFFGYM